MIKNRTQFLKKFSLVTREKQHSLPIHRSNFIKRGMTRERERKKPPELCADRNDKGERERDR